MIELVIEIYEKANNYAYPIVIHSFRGQTPEECLGYYKAHLESDTFLADCTKSGHYNNVECATIAYWRYALDNGYGWGRGLGSNGGYAGQSGSYGNYGAYGGSGNGYKGSVG